MASPFRVFRRHQKVMLAVLGILVMLSFVFGDMIMQMIGASQTQNPLVVTTAKFGDLNKNDVSFLKQRQAILLDIWRDVSWPNRENVPEFILKAINANLQREFGGLSTEEVVNSWLAVNYAKRMGICISDETITQFMRNSTKDQLSDDQWNAILSRHNVTKNFFFDLMRDALARRQFIQLYNFSMLGFTPAQRWDFYCRLNRKAAIQYVTLPVQQFVGQVKQEPTEEELEEFFNKYRFQVSRPDSPEPGFIVPKKIDCQYFQAELAAFTTPQTVSEEEIQTQYNSDPKRYDPLNREYLFQAEMKKAAQKKEAEKKEAEKKGPAAGDEPVKKPEGKEPAKSPADATPPAKKTETPPPVTPPANNPPKTSALGHGSIRLASLAEEKKSDPPPPAAVTPQNADSEGKTEENKSAPSSPATPTAATPSTPPETKATQGSSPTAQTPPMAKSETPTRPQRELAPELRDIIRREVEQKKSRAAAAEKIKTIFNDLREIMKKNGNDWNLYEVDLLKGKKSKEPPRLDFPALAKQYGCTSDNTKLITRWEADRWPIAQSIIQSEVAENPNFGGQAFTSYAFGSLGTYRPHISATSDGKQWFLFWTIQDPQKYSKEYVPKFTDPGIREKVLQEWRTVQARSLALEEANRLAAEARKNKEPLKTLAERHGLKLHTPDAFSWYVGGDPMRQSQLQFGVVDGIPLVGDDFMRAVFGLDKGELNCAMNRPKTEAYVVQVLDYEPASKTLWENFSNADFSIYANSAGADVVRAGAAWWKELQDNAGLKWKQPVTPAESRDGSEEEGW